MLVALDVSAQSTLLNFRKADRSDEEAVRLSSELNFRCFERMLNGNTGKNQRPCPAHPQGDPNPGNLAREAQSLQTLTVVRSTDAAACAAPATFAR